MIENRKKEEEECCKTRVLAIYLPQFHQTPDNDRWWGKGFTDWESVKNAERYFTDHNQPRIPLDDNYYDLNTYETMSRQASLAKQFSIDGFCFYHYYFAEGKMELEKPAENLLKWKDIDMPFCFNWASESWVRSWSKYNGNIWSEKYEVNDKDAGSGFLVKQDYGNSEDWKRHFDYLLPFFKDNRYIKVDGKPVFIFYNVDKISCIKEMISLWKNLSVENGFPGLYIVGAHMPYRIEGFDASIIYQPREAINRLNEKGRCYSYNGVRVFDYDELWDEIEASAVNIGMKTYYCAVTDYDDTPRRGKYGECLKGVSPEKFRIHFKELYKKSILNRNEFLLMNAWNEWGEGMYMEPDKLHGTAFLEAVRDVVESTNCHEMRKERQDDPIEYFSVNSSDMDDVVARDLEKYKWFCHIYSRWIDLFEEGIDIGDALLSKGLVNVGVYGVGILGKRLVSELKNSSEIRLFGIDRYCGNFGNVQVCRPEEPLPNADIVIVTAFDNTDVIKQLKEVYLNTGTLIIDIEVLLDSILNDLNK